MSTEDISLAILKFGTLVIGAGPVGWVIGVLIILAIVFFWWKFRKRIYAAIQSATERGRVEAQAKNPVENAEVEADAKKSEEAIEDIIKKEDT